MHAPCIHGIIQTGDITSYTTPWFQQRSLCNLVAVYRELFKTAANASMTEDPDPVDHRQLHPGFDDGTLASFTVISEQVAAPSSSIPQISKDPDDTVHSNTRIENYLVDENEPVHRKRKKCRRVPSANRSRQSCQECQASPVEEVMVCSICEYVAIYGRKPYALLLHPLIKEAGEEVAEILGVPRAQLEQKLPRAGSEYLLAGRKGKNGKYPVGLKESASTTRSSTPDKISEWQPGRVTDLTYGSSLDKRYSPIFKEMQLARHGGSSLRDVRKAVDAVESALIMDRLDEDPIKRVIQMARAEALLKPRRP